jgi:DNA repair protein RadD
VPFIGLSATPWSRGLGIIYDDLLQPVSIQELIDGGYLSDFRVFAPPGPNLASVRTTAGDFNELDLSEACDKTELIADIVRTWFTKGENRPTLCYGIDRKHAQHLQERFAEAGVAVEYIDCDTALFEREEIFDRFRASETKLICNVATLDTGIDLDVRCIIDARPTRSRIRFVQTLGRGLRPAEGKDFCIILDHAGNHRRLGCVTEINFTELHDGKSNRSLDKAKREYTPVIKLCPECHCVLPPRARVCPSCGWQIVAVTPIIEKPGELVELGSARLAVKHDPAEQIMFIAMLKGYAAERGYRDGWVWHKFKERFGVDANMATIRRIEPAPPDIKTRNWIKSRQIAWAKARANG